MIFLQGLILCVGFLAGYEMFAAVLGEPGLIRTIYKVLGRRE